MTIGETVVGGVVATDVFSNTVLTCGYTIGGGGASVGAPPKRPNGLVRKLRKPPDFAGACSGAFIGGEIIGGLGIEDGLSAKDDEDEDGSNSGDLTRLSGLPLFDGDSQKPVPAPRLSPRSSDPLLAGLVSSRTPDSSIMLSTSRISTLSSPALPRLRDLDFLCLGVVAEVDSSNPLTSRIITLSSPAPLVLSPPAPRRLPLLDLDAERGLRRGDLPGLSVAPVTDGVEGTFVLDGVAGCLKSGGDTRMGVIGPGTIGADTPLPEALPRPPLLLPLPRAQ
ncbi:MAG: hypothetical protein EHM41_00885 [Chloroflexi bacterium]|nr:MAG: hypothetical protein EHM41_00885 [Chloroflexota bacterium]